MNDFELINTEEEYLKYESKVRMRGGVHSIEVCNKPKEFPSIVCNSLLKHLNKKQIEDFLNKL